MDYDDGDGEDDCDYDDGEDDEDDDQSPSFCLAEVEPPHQCLSLHWSRHT